MKRVAGVLLVALICITGTALRSDARSRSLPAATVAARKHFFGVENVDHAGRVRRDRVILSWFSVASFAMAIDGHVVLLDSYIHKGEDHPNYVPTTTDELVALRPEAIFVGHGHFDHVNNAGRIVAQTGAVIVGTPEHCDEIKALTADFAGHPMRVRCYGTVKRGSEPGSEVREIRPLGPRVGITVLKHLHSANEPPDGENHESIALAGLPDPNLILLHPPGPSVVAGADPGGDEGWSLLYQFRIGRFSLVWNDTVGPLREEAPKLLGVFRKLRSTDVQVGAVLGFNGVTNGVRDPVDYLESLRPKIFYPNHHDFVAEYGASRGIEGIFRREMAKRKDLHVDVRWLYDPSDYLRPQLLTFDPTDDAFVDER
jgi:hypothetical protein